MNSTEVLSCYLGGNDGGDDGRRRGDGNGMDDDSGKDSGSGNDGGGGEGGEKEGSSHTQLSTSTHRQKSVDAYTSPHKILYSTDKSSMKKEDIRPRKEKGKRKKDTTNTTRPSSASARTSSDRVGETRLNMSPTQPRLQALYCTERS